MTAREIIMKNIPNGIVNHKPTSGGNGKPQYRAEIDIITKCMEEFAEQEIKKLSSNWIFSVIIKFIKWYNQITHSPLKKNPIIAPRSLIKDIEENPVWDDKK